MKYISLGLFSFAHKKNADRAIETQKHYWYFSFFSLSNSSLLVIILIGG